MNQEDKVLFYERPGYVFSNFSSFQVEWQGVLWPTSEHAYQAAKFDDQDIVEEIKNAKSAHEAYKLATVTYKDRVRSDWDTIKIDVMEEILRAKLAQHPYVQKELARTDKKEIIEDSPRDSFWGRGPDWKGKNHLGKLWMKIRDEK